MPTVLFGLDGPVTLHDGRPVQEVLTTDQIDRQRPEDDITW